MGGMFDKPEKKQPTKQQIASANAAIMDKDRAILGLKNARDKIKKYKKKLEVETKNLQEQAKSLVTAGKKDRALLLLKLKRMKEGKVDEVDGQLISVLGMIETIEWQSQNVEILLALENGNKALKKLNDEIPIDYVESLLEDTQEAIAKENEISRLLSGGCSADIDEAELEDELSALVGQEQSVKQTSDLKMRLDEQSLEKTASILSNLPSVPTSPILPSAPTSSIQSQNIHLAEQGQECEKTLLPSI